MLGISYSLAGMWKTLGWYALAACLLLELGAGTVWYFVAERLAAKDAQIRALNGAVLRAAEQRALDQATLDRLARKNAATARESALAQAALQRSLAQNRAWADQPVPPEVRDALRKP